MIQRKPSQETKPAEKSVELFSLDAEMCVVSSCYFLPKNIDLVSSIVHREDFFDEPWGMFFEMIQNMHEMGKPITDPALISNQLRETGIYKLIGGKEGLDKLYFYKAQQSHAVHYSKIVRKFSLLRKQVAFAGELLAMANHEKADPYKVAEWIETKNETFGDYTKFDIERMDSVASKLIAEIEDNLLKGRNGGVPTGLPTFDSTAGFMMPGELTILAARPGVGKTSLATQIAVHNVTNERGVLFLTLEMLKKELTQRVVCTLGNVNSRDVRANDLDAEDIKRLKVAEELMKEKPFYLIDVPMSISAIRAAARLQKMKTGFDLIVIDYIGLIDTGTDDRKRHELLSKVAKGLKNLAKEMQVPILCLCQLNRAADDGKPLQLSNLAECGDIERVADMVLFLSKNASDEYELTIRKHRHGETGFVKLGFQKARTSFTDESQPQRYDSLDQWNDPTDTLENY